MPPMSGCTLSKISSLVRSTAVATSVAEAEAHIAPARHRFWKFKRYPRSPLYQVADVLKDLEMETLETINPFTLAPWEERVQTDLSKTLKRQIKGRGSMQIAISSSARNKIVDFSGAIQKQPPQYIKPKLKTFSVTLGIRSEQNPYSGELTVIAHAL